MIPVLAIGLSVATSLMFKEGDEGQVEVEAWIDTMVKTVAPMLDLEVRLDLDSGSLVGPVQNHSEGVFQTSEMWNQVAFPERFSEIVGDQNNVSGGRRREVARQIAEFVSKIHTRTIGVTSVCVFLVVAIMLLRAIERTFNQVWEIPKNRSWGAGVAQYWAGLTLGPFLLIVGTGLSSSSTLHHFTIFILGMGWLGRCLLFVLAWLITGSACALVYRIMTNTRVTIRAAAAGGLAAGLLLQLNSQLSAVYFSNVATVNKVYGSLGAIPILLLGLYVSWIILVFGSHVAYLVQFPFKEARGERDSDNRMVKLDTIDAIRMLQLIAERFKKGQLAFTLEELSDALSLDLADVSELSDLLVDGGLLFRGPEPDVRVTLAKPSDSITLELIYQVLENEKAITMDHEISDPCLLAHLKVLAIRNRSASEITVSDLVQTSS